MMKGLMNNPGNPLLGIPSTLSPLGSGIPSGGATPASRQTQKFESRLHQVEQSNRALLEELMKIQNELKILTRKEQQHIEEKIKVQQNYEQALKLIQSKIVETEERAKKTEHLNSEMRQTIQQMQLSLTRRVNSGSPNTQLKTKELETENVIAAIKSDLDDMKGKMKNSEERIAQYLDASNATLRKRKSSAAMRSKEDDDRLRNLQQQVQEITSKLISEAKIREILENQINVNSKTQVDSNDPVNYISKEMHQILEVEIQTRRDQFNFLSTQIEECHSNIRAGISAIQNSIENSSSSKTNWKLDALKVRDISQETTNEMRKSIDLELQEIRTEQENFKNLMTQTKQNEKLTPVQINKKSENLTEVNDLQVLGNQLDQRVDHLSFNQEKLKKQIIEMQAEIRNIIIIKNESLSYSERLESIDRKLKARIDGEAKDRIIEGKNLKNEIEIMKKNNFTSVPAEAAKNSFSTEDIKIIKTELEKSKVNFRKMAESIQVVKTTLNDQLTEETKIRKDETGKLENDLSKIKSWIKSNSKEN